MDRPVLLVTAPFTAKYRESGMAGFLSAPPLGLLYLSAYLKQAGYNVVVDDLMMRPPRRSVFLELLERHRPAVVGISALAVTYDGAVQLAAAAREALPDAKIVLGGAHPQFIADEVFSQSVTDFIVAGEGEETLLELCDTLYGRSNRGFADIKGLLYRDGDGYKRNPARPLIEDLDSLPLPDRDAVDLRIYRLPYTIATSRGCVGQCVFCCAPALWGGRARLRGVESVKAELRLLREKYRMDTLFVTDDTFTVSHERVHAICDFLIEEDFRIRWYCNTRATANAPELMAKMYQAGCRKLLVGAESGDENVLFAVRKAILPEDVEACVKNGMAAGIDVSCSFMLGHHADTLDSIKKTVQFAKHLVKTYNCHVVLLTNSPYPGTYQYEHAEELGLKTRHTSWSEFAGPRILKRTAHLTEEMLEDLDRGKIGDDLDTLPDLLRNDPPEKPEDGPIHQASVYSDLDPLQWALHRGRVESGAAHE
ncbi:MAG: radical SAM protein [FCB group bacterium]|jgi:radical SAM superfamily enzyme YgiQ (UPF0313 family)|nr:radical SAM protein [FCB group bacterium]